MAEKDKKKKKGLKLPMEAAEPLIYHLSFQ